MKFPFFRAALVAALAVAAAGAAAQGEAEAVPPGWQQALDAAWQRAQEQAQRRSQLQRAEAERSAADVPWAAPPSLELDHRIGRAAGNGSVRESEVGVVWPVRMPGQRQAGIAAADAEVQAAQRGLASAQWRLGGELLQSALAVAAQQAEARHAELQVRLVRALAEDVDRRVAAGDLARADAMAAHAELLQAQVQQQDSVQRLQQARARWELLTGLAGIPAIPPLAAQGARGEHPDLTAAAAAVEHARRRLAAAESSRRDPPEVGVRLRRDTDSSGSASSVGVSLRVPIASGPANAALLAQARSDLELALSDEQRVHDRIAIESQSARALVESARQQHEAERSRAQLLRQRAELIAISFRAGDTALPDLLRALAAAAQAEAAVLQQEAAVQQAQARLLQSLGGTP